MKLRLEIDDKLTEDEIIIRARQLDEKILSLQKIISEQTKNQQKIVGYQGEKEFYLPIQQIMFFETEGNDTMGHTGDEAYKVNLRLYELEDILPGAFVRVSKSTILNINSIFAIDKNMTASSIVSLHNSHKKVYVSRHYYRLLKDRLDEKRYLK